MEYISLAQLIHRAPVYERLPKLLQDALRRSVWLSLITEVALLLVLVWMPHHVFQTRLHQGGFFLLEPTVDLSNQLFKIGYEALPYLFLINLGNLFLLLLVLTISLGMMIPAREPVHWLAAANAVPAAISVAMLAAVIIVLVAVVIINLVAWAIIIFVVLSVIGAVLGSN
ncbi:MAG: hypothetical protein JXQ72_02820 [Anaerolineae bacterium]|nr:hypothetical protein [Anaerolineae bacterium]